MGCCPAVIKDLNHDTVSVEITLPDGRSVNQALLQSGLVLECPGPLPESVKLRKNDPPTNSLPALPPAVTPPSSGATKSSPHNAQIATTPTQNLTTPPSANTSMNSAGATPKMTNGHVPQVRKTALKALSHKLVFYHVMNTR